ncbi:hypothetical protein WMF39_10145 [Sorangium sp. So ce1504]|uniref:carboxylesterase family protein n=1 Tax=Sorangium sp. So ce1504 TaxID=3133337 RepID=UPI003F5FCD7B
MSGARWARRARRATQAVVAATGLALLALRYVIPALMMQAHPIGSTPSPYGYVEYVPPEPGPRPLLLVLHGGSSRGDGRHPRAIIHRLPPLRYLARARLFGTSSPLVDAGVLIAAPQSPGEWDPATIDAFLDYLLSTHEIDRDRIYVTGPSMGGCGTWRYAAVHPERLAAALPICGACPQTGELAAGLRTLPVRAFHAFDDEVVPNTMSATWVSAIAALRGTRSGNPMLSYPPGSDSTAVFYGGGVVWRPGTGASADEALTLTEFARGGHAVFVDVYAEDATWRWLFAQRRGARAQ